MIITMMAALLIAVPPLFQPLDNSPGVEVRLPLDASSPLKKKGGPVSNDDGEGVFVVGLFNDETGKIGAPLFGKYQVRDGELVFIPSQPFSLGKTYKAIRTDTKDKEVSQFKVPALKAQDVVRVEKVYPTTDRVPANLLKFTIVFSGPMRQSKTIFDAIELVGPDGKSVDDPWRRTELWNDNDTRLTLWFHPGRVKLGVNLREQLGPPLEPGKTYTLKIPSELLDASGNKLAQGFEKKIIAGAEVRTRLDVNQWKIIPPVMQSKAALAINFPYVIDPYLFAREVIVVGPTGKIIAGVSSMGLEEKVWQFVPDEAWQLGEYTIRVGSEVADLAGNTISRPFEVNLETLEPLAGLQKLKFLVK